MQDTKIDGCGCDSGTTCCDSRYNGVSRRDFIALVGVGAAGMLASPAWGEWVKRQADPAKLAAWKADLFKAATQRKYHSSTHTDAKMPLGGIGTGNFELGADGQFTTWQLFNTLRDGHVPFFFGISVGGVSRLLQTSGGPDWPRIKSIEMTGEYPFAGLKFTDPELPVSLAMTGFTPFAPLDAEFSSIPAACFAFRIRNTSANEQKVSLAGFLQNVIGYDAIGVPISFNSVGFNAVAERKGISHPNYGGNYNHSYREGAATVLAMQCKPGTSPTLNRDTHLITNLDTRQLLSKPDDRPGQLTIGSIEQVRGESKEPTANTIVWLEDAPVELAVDSLQKISNLVESGAVLVLSGANQPLLKAYGDATGGKSVEKIETQPEILFEDFEHGYGNWTVTGEAFGTEPAHGTLPGQQQVSGFHGQGLVNSFLKGDGTTGKMTSKPFLIERKFIRFLIGGGSSDATQIRLIVDGKIVRAQSGKETEHLLPAIWNVRDIIGKTAHIEIIDEGTGGWGHINIDDIAFTDDPGSHATYVLLEKLLPVRFAGAKTTGTALELQAVVLEEGAKSSEEPVMHHRAYSTTHGSGKVVVVCGSVLTPTNAELTGARQLAYSAICGLAGLHYTAPDAVPATAPGFGELALMTLGAGATVLTEFTDWSDAWKRFADSGQFNALSLEQTKPTERGVTVNGALASTVTLAAGAEREIVFSLAWRYPNKYNEAGKWMGCHYAEQWKSTAEVAKTIAAEYPKLRARTERFRKAMYDSTLPYWLLDCVTSQISTIRHSGVVFRIANGDVYGWEGSNGCCDPTCTHVWGYEQTLAHVFPSLERSMREIDYKHQQRADGGIDNRTEVPSPPRPTGEQPFSDGHASCILKAYREALNSPDDRFLKEYYPRVKGAVNYLIGRDAATSGGVPDGTLSDDQWNTYDNSIHGVNSFIGSYYLAALRAGEEMAKRVGDNEAAGRFRGVFEKGRTRLVELCWNGEYFQQHLPDYMNRSGEYGPGCLSDQLLGQWWAHQLGLGYLLPAEHVKTALQSIFKYNWLPDFSNFHHNWRKFAGGSDRGLLICTWPKGGRPANTIPYVDEVWTGVEYQVAGHMLYEGMLEQGLAIVKSARDRYDGAPRDPMPRNPWNEIECGGHYARAMSSWSVLTALSGFRYDGISASLEFAPRHTPDNFKSLFTGPEAWGSVKQTRSVRTQRNEIAVTEGSIRISTLQLESHTPVKKVMVSVGSRKYQASHTVISNAITVTLPTVTVKQGETLVVNLS